MTAPEDKLKDHQLTVNQRWGAPCAGCQSFLDKPHSLMEAAFKHLMCAEINVIKKQNWPENVSALRLSSFQTFML